MASDSMAPELQRGDLVVVAPTHASRVQVGDIVIIAVPGPIQDRYGYPSSIVHRVVEVDRSVSGGLAFRTQGDNTNEDPFTTFPGDIRGRVDRVYDHAGYPLLFLSSGEWRAFVVFLVGIWAFHELAPYVERKGRRARDAVTRAWMSPLDDRLARFENRQEATLLMVHRSMDSFSEAMGEYATHLKSHTAAVQALAAAADELRQAARVRQDEPRGPEEGTDGGDADTRSG